MAEHPTLAEHMAWLESIGQTPGCLCHWRMKPRIGWVRMNTAKGCPAHPGGHSPPDSERIREIPVSADPPDPPPPDVHASAAFHAVTCIEQGEWDRYLLRLQAVIRARLASSEWGKWRAGSHT
jgi:hypothetical protein